MVDRSEAPRHLREIEALNSTISCTSWKALPVLFVLFERDGIAQIARIARPDPQKAHIFKLLWFTDFAS